MPISSQPLVVFSAVYSSLSCRSAFSASSGFCMKRKGRTFIRKAGPWYGDCGGGELENGAVEPREVRRMWLGRRGRRVMLERVRTRPRRASFELRKVFMLWVINACGCDRESMRNPLSKESILWWLCSIDVDQRVFYTRGQVSLNLK